MEGGAARAGDEENEGRDDSHFVRGLRGREARASFQESVRALGRGNLVRAVYRRAREYGDEAAVCEGGDGGGDCQDGIAPSGKRDSRVRFFSCEGEEYPCDLRNIGAGLRREGAGGFRHAAGFARRRAQDGERRDERCVSATGDRGGHPRLSCGEPAAVGSGRDAGRGGARTQQGDS